MFRLEREGNEIRSVDDWFRLASPPMAQWVWKDGRSAKELARACCPVDGHPIVPPDVKNLLATAGLGDASFDVGFPKHRVQLPIGGADRKYLDLGIVGHGAFGPLAIVIEAYANAQRGNQVVEEIVRAALQWAFDERDTKLKPLMGLISAMLPRRVAGGPPVGELRFELLKTIAGAWAFAGQHNAPTVIVVFQEFAAPGHAANALKDNDTDLSRIMHRLTKGSHTLLEPGAIAGPFPTPKSQLGHAVHQWYFGRCRTEVSTGTD